MNGLLAAGLVWALAWLRPVYGYDAVSMWALKAKISFLAQTWPATMWDKYTTHHVEYPPLFPVAQAWIHFGLGTVDDVASRVVSVAFYLAGAVWLGWLARRLGAAWPWLWVLWWCALPVLVEQVRISYADLPLAVFVLFFAGGVLLWLREPTRPGWLLLGALMGGMAFWVKTDAFLVVGGGLAALWWVAWRRALPMRWVGLANLLVLAILLPWHLVVLWKELPSGYAMPTEILLRLPQIVGALVGALLDVDAYGYFWVLFLLSLLWGRGRFGRSEVGWLLMSLGFGAVLLVGVYLGSRVNLAAQLQTSIQRVLLNLYVPALLVMMLLTRGSYQLLRRDRWQWWGGAVAVVLMVGQFWLGATRPSSLEQFGLVLSPYPTAFGLVLAGAGVVSLRVFWRVRQRFGWALVARAGRFLGLMAGLGAGLAVVGVTARESGELWRRYGQLSLAQQHRANMDPLVWARLEGARRQYPFGTHVRVLPKHNWRYHQFHYHGWPHLVVDASAPITIRLDQEPSDNR